MFEITGERTDGRWAGHIVADRIEAPGWGERYRMADVADGTRVYYHRYVKSDDYSEEVTRLRTAIEVASLPDIAASPVIVRLLDVHETIGVTGEYGYPGVLGAVWELADVSLQGFRENPDDDPIRVASEVEVNVGCALETLHALGWIHLDVAPHNVLRVNGRWKLGDLDSCTRRGEPVRRNPGIVRYIHPKRRTGVAMAVEDFDRWGLAEILRALREN